MHTMPANSKSAAQSQSRRSRGWLAWAAIWLLAILASIFAVWSFYTGRSTPPAEAGGALSAAELEARYGLKVRLIGVTAAGGMVDFRLKILDPEKASQLLHEGGQLPTLYIPGQDVELAAGDQEQKILLEEGGIFFILFPNSGGAVKPGEPVVVRFGELELEPIPAQ